MEFKAALKKFDTLLANGPLGTRLKYDYGYNATFDLTEEKEGRQALTEIYEGDIAIAHRYHLPIILNASTFRASRHHLQNAGFNAPKDVQRINTNCINLIKTIKAQHSASPYPIFIGAPLGSMYDAYQAEVIPSVEKARQYHQEQLTIFKKLNVDFANAVTLPSLNEALGIALAAEQIHLNYCIGFILSEEGTLLDGTPVEQAIQTIDAQTTQPPLGYLVTCTHTSVIHHLTHTPEKHPRLIGIKPNGSNLPPTTLAALNAPVADAPEQFAKDLLDIKTKLKLKIISGCCGTTVAHLEWIARLCAQGKT